MTVTRVPVMSNGDDLTDAIVEGTRRAYQYLALLDSDPEKAATFLADVDTASPVPLLAVGKSLQSIARSIDQHRSEEKQAEFDARRAALDHMFQTHKNSKSGLLSWVRAVADDTLLAVTERFPDRSDRIALFAAGGRIAYEAGAPESPFRNVFAKPSRQGKGSESGPD